MSMVRESRTSIRELPSEALPRRGGFQTKQDKEEGEFHKKMEVVEKSAYCGMESCIHN